MSTIDIDSLYPEHAKIQKISAYSQEIGEFLTWLEEEKHLFYMALLDEECEETDGLHAVPTSQSKLELLAEYFEIDLMKLEDEKRAMLDQLWKGASQQ